MKLIEIDERYLDAFTYASIGFYVTMNLESVLIREF